MTEYAPYPEFELKQLADWHDNAAKVLPDDSIFHSLHANRATVCRNANEAHTALRERCLLAELNLRSAETLLQAHGLPFQRVSVETPHAA